jgi:hypothetical protein
MGRACSVSSGSSHPGCFWRATASWCVVAGRPGRFRGSGEDYGGSPGPCGGATGRVVQGIAASMKGTAFIGSKSLEAVRKRPVQQFGAVVPDFPSLISALVPPAREVTARKRTPSFELIRRIHLISESRSFDPKEAPHQCS